MTFKEYIESRPPVRMSDIRPDVRELAVAWAEDSGMSWIGDKHKLASDIQHYADWYSVYGAPNAGQ